MPEANSDPGIAHELWGDEPSHIFLERSGIRSPTRAKIPPRTLLKNPPSRGRTFPWLETPAPKADLMLANLFLHHFEDAQLIVLLRLAAARTHQFIACEPRRSPLALTAAHALALIGCNAVTRHDAIVSVRAGFAGRELSALWPEAALWHLREHPAGLFSHAFSAQENA